MNQHNNDLTTRLTATPEQQAKINLADTKLVYQYKGWSLPYVLY